MAPKGPADFVFFEGMVAKVAYHQNKIKYLLENSGRGGDPNPFIIGGSPKCSVGRLWIVTSPGVKESKWHTDHDIILCPTCSDITVASLSKAASVFRCLEFGITLFCARV